MKCDVYVCIGDPRLYLLVPEGVQPRQAVPQHTMIYLKDVKPVATGRQCDDAAGLVGAEPGRLGEALRGKGHMVHRVSKHEPEPSVG